ncbi:MAG TPA: nucleotidyltransferase [Candidatus Ruthenibacterium merdigallinarum]|nr:nucleotidyltransferase [Candidatus Ruthenibacterium merdigallinarum]
MKKPILVVMAAGMGSRYGGLKQIDPVGNHGQIIIDYSIFDARRAGFETVVFIIKHEIEDAFKAAIGDRLSKIMDVRYAFQQLDDLPAGYAVPEGRTKPWGTSHAILAARDIIDAPFAVINADDYYGPEAFKEIYNYLSTHADDEKYRYAMVGYLLKNTVTENGSVARGVCVENADGTLASVTERTKIETFPGGIHFTEDDGKTWTDVDPDSVVSMNLWGFTPSFIDETKARFSAFLDKALAENPLKGEYFLPSVVSQLIAEDKATVQVLRSTDKWYGVTYKEDKPVVVAAIAEKTAAGLYPDNLWEA